MTETSKTPLDFIYTQITDGIRVSVVSEPLIASSDPTRNVFSFVYTISIENLGQETAQLLERHWVIKSAGVQIAEVVGPGVIGQQPVLAAGEMFQYSSGAVIQDPVGSMEGSYTLRTEDGRYFEVMIPRFELAYPIVIH